MKEDLTKATVSQGEPVEQEPEFTFADAEEEAFGISTAEYPNGNLVKRLNLSDGSVIVVRELTGYDMQKVETMAGGKQENVVPACMSLAAKINGKLIPMEDYLKLKAKDYNKLKLAVMSLNF